MGKETSRKKRGEIDHEYQLALSNAGNNDLISKLEDPDPQIRTASATLLGERKCHEAIDSLCRRLVKEKALYSKIAISEALGAIGITALAELLKYIGKIGRNQHKELPAELFKKWNYPLPRDIVIRTIIKMESAALPSLCIELMDADAATAAELIDAIGHISFYCNDQSSFNILLQTLHKHTDQQVIIWKILRALQAFPNQESIDLLTLYFMQNPLPALRREAARSLGQLGSVEILKQGLNDPDPLVVVMIKRALDHNRPT